MKDLFLFLVACGTVESQEAPKLEGLLIRGGTIQTMIGPDLENGAVHIANGCVRSVGPFDPKLESTGLRVVDARGKVVVPGFIDALTRIGIWEIDRVPQTRDELEGGDVVTPDVWVGDAINLASELISVARLNGITTVLTAPGDQNVVSGVSALWNLEGRLVGDMLVKPRVAMHVNFGEPVTGRWREENVVQTRMGIAAKIRETLTKTQEYARKKAEYEKKKETDSKAEPPAFDAKHEALIPVIRGEMSVIARAHRRDDIWTAIRIAEEFQLKLILLHGTEAWKIADEIAKRKIPVLVGPITVQPDSIETLGATYENADLLHRAGVKIAIVSNEQHNVRNLPFMAGIAAAYGLPRSEALKAITVNPAEILGVADHVGVLKEGALANLVIFDGDPLQPRSKVEHVFIAGREIPLKSRQTALYEQYRNP